MPSLDDALDPGKVDGWANAETARVWLWIANDQKRADALASIADGVLGAQASLGDLAQILKTLHAKENTVKDPLLRELLNIALGRVDWPAIAAELWQHALERKGQIS